MDQYVRWAGGRYHDSFYRDPRIRAWHKAWISHLLNRVNMITGVAYKDDPTIMTWELGNEPRCARRTATLNCSSVANVIFSNMVIETAFFTTSGGAEGNPSPPGTRRTERAASAIYGFRTSWRGVRTAP